jgi:drug/metabolite transporter (DMT)-like permease
MRRGKLKELGIFLVLILIWTAVQVFLKLGMDEFAGRQVNVRFFLKALSSWPVLVGFFLAVVGSLIWMVVLSRFDLGYSNLVVSLTFVFVALASVVFFKEQISLLRWVGAGLIVLGVFLVAQAR